MTPEIRKFVDDQVLTQTPQEIYHHLLSSGLTTVDEIAEHQVYYLWRQANKSYWRRDNDPVLSAGILLEENRDMYHHRSISVANVRALGLYIRASIDALPGTTREIAIDATYGTNNAGMELYAVLAELDGTGAPMAYLFVEKNNSSGTSSPGTMTQVIYQFLRVLDNLGSILLLLTATKINLKSRSLRVLVQCHILGLLENSLHQCIMSVMVNPLLLVVDKFFGNVIRYLVVM